MCIRCCNKWDRAHLIFRAGGSLSQPLYHRWTILIVFSRVPPDLTNISSIAYGTSDQQWPMKKKSFLLLVVSIQLQTIEGAEEIPFYIGDQREKSSPKWEWTWLLVSIVVDLRKKRRYSGPILVALLSGGDAPTLGASSGKIFTHDCLKNL